MTSSVKGPGGPSNITPPPLERPGEAERGTKTAFRDALAEARAQAAPAAAPRDPIAQALLEGKIDAKGAVDALVERALSSGMAQGLTPEGVEALRAHLVGALEHDPALASLVRDLESGET